VLHKAHEPDVLAQLFDADVLTGKDSNQVHFATTDADAVTVGDRDCAVMKGIFQKSPHRGAANSVWTIVEVPSIRTVDRFAQIAL
jgi:hypothetical protein